MKIDWKAKLSSRKLWAALAGVVTALMAAFGIGDMTIAQVASVLSAVGCWRRISWGRAWWIRRRS